VLSGYLGKFSVAVPWRNLSKERVVVTIEDVFLVAVPNHGIAAACSGVEAAAERLDGLRAALELRLKHVAEREMLRQAMNETDADAGGDGTTSMAERLGRIVLNNLQVTIKNVHCRFEEVPLPDAPEAATGAQALRPVAMGVKLTELQIRTIDEHGRETFQTDGTAQNKEIRLQGLALYSENPPDDDQLSRKLTAGAGDADLRQFFKAEFQRLESAKRRYIVATQEDIVLRAKLPERGTKQISSVLKGLQVRREQWKFVLDHIRTHLHDEIAEPGTLGSGTARGCHAAGEDFRVIEARTGGAPELPGLRSIQAQGCQEEAE
jgi:hypothetical protein